LKKDSLSNHSHDCLKYNFSLQLRPRLQSKYFIRRAGFSHNEATVLDIGSIDSSYTSEEIERRDLSFRPSLLSFSPIYTSRSPSRWAYTVMYTVIQLHRAVIIHPGVSHSPFYCYELIKLRITAETELFFLLSPSQILNPFAFFLAARSGRIFVIFNLFWLSGKRRFHEIRSR